VEFKDAAVREIVGDLQIEIGVVRDEAVRVEEHRDGGQEDAGPQEEKDERLRISFESAREHRGGEGFGASAQVLRVLNECFPRCGLLAEPVFPIPVKIYAAGGTVIKPPWDVSKF